MELEKFTMLFAEQFDDTNVAEIKAETVFKELDEWSSLVALSVISMVDEEWDKQLTGADLRNVRTVEELYNLLKAK